MRKLYLLLSLLIPGFMATSQVVVDQTLTIDEYVNDILLGSGIQASNISFTGSMVQLGYVSGAGDVGFPLEGGLIMSTEDAINVQGDGAFGTIPAGEEVSGEPDLLSVANSVPPLIGQNFNVSSVNDVAILEFDFIATGDTMRFNYSFGSDEYLEWVNSSYNDIFAFFLSGPGITGPYDSPAGFPNGAINIAEIPDTDPQVPITISSVNDNLNTAYYIDNFNNDGVAIDGYTVKLTAWSVVECGETYHIKLAIADGSDTALESIVILEEGSFESNSVVEVSLTTDVGIFYDDAVIYEDCGLATLTFVRPLETILELEEMVIINYSGTAINGVDVTLLPDTVFFPPFVDVVEFELDAFWDNVDEGVETVVFEILNVAACGGGGLTTYFEFTIDDYPEPLTVEGYNLSICQGDTIELEPIISGGYGNFSFEWSNGSTDYILVDDPDLSTTYNVIVSDTCGMPPDNADFDVEVQFFPPLEIQINEGDITLSCGESIVLTTTVSGGDGNYSGYYWYDDNGSNLFGWTTLWFSTWSGSEEVYVEVTDGCGFTATDMINVDLDIPELIVEMDPELTVLCNDPFTLVPDIVGGESPFWYNWYVDGMWTDWQSTFTYTTDENVTITVDVGDNCGQIETFDTEIIVTSPPIEIDLLDEMVGNCLTQFDVDAEVSGGSGYQYVWTQNGVVIGNTQDITFQSDVNTTLDLFVSANCNVQASEQINIVIDNPPVLVELGDDINASCVDFTDIGVDVLSGAGQYQYQWAVDGEDVSTDDQLTWQSYETAEVAVSVWDGCGGFDQDTVMLIIPDIPLAIGASNDTTLCLGQGTVLVAEAEGGEGGFIYEWQPTGTFGSVYGVTPFSSTLFTVTATDICGESITEQVQVNVVEQYASYDETYLTETDVQFTAMPTPECENCTYIWDFGDGTGSNEENPLHIYDGLTGYDVTLVIVNEFGCIDTAHGLIFGPPIVYIPNAFTPNNDGVNDYWGVVADQLLRFEVTVFDRWGEIVFTSKDPMDLWNGSVTGGDYYAPNGTYTYVCEYKGFNSDAMKKMGTITLMR
ncbi:MAG: choice-of-anchor L domain-containing protein [Flavobacteriales bacterium]|nr:choice-of-anchor L domain-containing protein [Flavobacteriales bacterium]